MYQATVNKKTFDIEPGEDGFKFQNTTVAWDIQRTGDGHYHILYGGKSYSAELVKFNAATKSFTFKVNGRIYQVDVRDRFDILLEKMGMNNASAGKVNNIKAPMPGLIIELKVKPGDVVHPGDSLLILEAMKMENVIKSPGEGTVKSVKIKKGDSVEKNQVLIEF